MHPVKYIGIFLLCTLSLLSCVKDQPDVDAKRAQEEVAIENYIQENSLSPIIDLDSVFYYEKIAGTGAAVDSGMIVSVSYTGSLLNGTVFDQQDSFSYTHGGSPEMMTGWTVGLDTMRVGSSALLIIPFDYAWGDRKYGSVPAFSTLIYDVTVLDVTE